MLYEYSLKLVWTLFIRLLFLGIYLSLIFMLRDGSRSVKRLENVLEIQKKKSDGGQPSSQNGTKSKNTLKNLNKNAKNYQNNSLLNSECVSAAD